MSNFSEIISLLTAEDDFFKMIVTPIEFLTETE